MIQVIVNRMDPKEIYHQVLPQLDMPSRIKFSLNIPQSINLNAKGDEKEKAVNGIIDFAKTCGVKVVLR